MAEAVGISQGCSTALPRCVVYLSREQVRGGQRDVQRGLRHRRRRVQLLGQVDALQLPDNRSTLETATQ